MDFSRFFASTVDTSLALRAYYDLYLVAASYVIAVLAGFAFLRFARRIGELSLSIARFAWMMAGAVTMGLGVWAMHFVAMLAYRLPIAVSYDPLITTLSILPAVIGSAIALHAVASPRVTMSRLAAGAVALGAGIATMHYTGMAALHFDAFINYDAALFAASIVVAVALAFAALFTTLWLLKQGSSHLVAAREGTGSLILGLAVSGMHYTAMTSAYCFAADSVRATPGIKTEVFSAMTAIAAILVLLLVIGGILFDRRLRIEIERREKVQARLLQAQKMEALGNLAGGFAHEFNNALLPILTLTEMALDDLPDNYDGRANLSTVLDAALHAKHLVNQVMVFTRHNNAELTEIDVSNVVADGVKELRSKTGPKLLIAHAIDPDIGRILGGADQVRAVILHLGSNAAQAKAKEIHVTLSRVAAKTAANAGLDPDHRYGRLTVHDNGTGMDDDTIAKIFNPFFTTNDVGKGTGLGLAMVHGIVRRFNGIIAVRSAIGVGTTFDIYLPLLAQRAASDFANAA